MPRVKRGVTTNRRHKKILKAAKGFRGRRNSVFKLAKNAVMKAGQNAYRDRRLKKRSFHGLWILRINAACRQLDIKYSRFIYGMELAGINLNRKMLSELAIHHMDVFEEVVKKVKEILPPQGEAPNLEELKKRFAKASASPKSEEKEVPAKKEKVEAAKETQPKKTVSKSSK